MSESIFDGDCKDSCMNKLRGMEKKSVGRDCRDGFRNTWGDEIVR